MSRSRVAKKLLRARNELADLFEDLATRPKTSEATTAVLAQLVRALRRDDGKIPSHFESHARVVARQMDLTVDETNRFFADVLAPRVWS